MKAMRDEWDQLDAAHRQPFERAAARDTDRYLREVRSA